MGGGSGGRREKGTMTLSLCGRTKKANTPAAIASNASHLPFTPALGKRLAPTAQATQTTMSKTDKTLRMLCNVRSIPYVRSG